MDIKQKQSFPNSIKEGGRRERNAPPKKKNWGESKILLRGKFFVNFKLGDGNLRRNDSLSIFCFNFISIFFFQKSSGIPAVLLILSRIII